jgi:hypothetical protein
MSYLFFLSISYFSSVFIILVAIQGYGRLINKFLPTNPDFHNFYNYFFILGLIFVGTFSVIFNFLFPINDFYSLIVILFGLLIFSYFAFIESENLLHNIFNFFFISIISFLISFFAGVNDDYGYHYSTINNFKNLNLFEIEHIRNTSYNSHWLFLNSVFSLKSFKPSLFILTSLIYSIAVFDLYKNFNKYLINKFYFIAFYILFALIFLLGVLNIYKDFGTDIPGVLISIYILVFCISFIYKKGQNFNVNSIVIILLFSNFAIMVKLTNALIYLYLFILVFNLKFKNHIKIKIFIAFIPLSLWIVQNIIISGCLIWPISSLCFYGIESAKLELYLIESFAKGSIATNIDVNGLSWISIWLKSHLNKLIEIYATFVIFLIIPILYYNFRYRKKVIYNLFSKSTIKSNLKFLYLSLIIFISNLIWFFYSPAYRFGIFYNLNFFIILLMPFWIKIYKIDLLYIKKCAKILLIIATIFFSYKNLNRYEGYLKKYDNVWPPFIDDKLILK